MAIVGIISLLWLLVASSYTTPLADHCRGLEEYSTQCHPSRLVATRNITYKEYDEPLPPLAPVKIQWQKIWLRGSDFGDWSSTNCRFYTFVPLNKSINIVARAGGLILYPTLNFQTCSKAPCAFHWHDVWHKCPIDFSKIQAINQTSLALTDSFYSFDFDKKLGHLSTTGKQKASVTEFIFLDFDLNIFHGLYVVAFRDDGEVVRPITLVYPANHTDDYFAKYSALKALDWWMEHTPWAIIWPEMRSMANYLIDVFTNVNALSVIFLVFYAFFMAVTGMNMVSVAMSVATTMYIHHTGLFT